MNPPTSGPADGADFRAVLGLPALFTIEDARAAYRRQVMQAHPDRGGDVGEFLRLQDAFERAAEYIRIRGDGRGWIAVQVRNYVPQQQVAAEVRRRGGAVTVEETGWLKESVGEGFAMLAERLRGIRLRGPAADDAFLAFLGEHRPGLQYLLELDLAGGRVTDAGLLRLAGLELLRRLDVSGSTVTRGGLEKLLGTLPALLWLNVADTGVGWLGRRLLGRAHPQLQVVAERPGPTP
jgi:hypothetical protein